jgi:hypothetical protein
MDEPLSDVVNDVGGAGEPGFVHVAICTGSDIDAQPITLVDRMCINRPGIDMLVADMNMCEQQLKLVEGHSESCTIGLDRANKEWTIIAMSELFIIIMFCVYGIVRLARRP